MYIFISVFAQKLKVNARKYFQKTDISTNAFPFKFPIWVPSRDPPKLFKMNSFKWTVVFAIALHSSFAFLSIPLHSCFLIFIPFSPFHSSVSLPGSNN